MSSNINYVIKRDGTKEVFAPEKYMMVCIYGCEDIARVSASDLSLRALHRLHDEMTTAEIQHMLVRTAVDMVEEEANYDQVAARLLNFDIRKKVYGSYDVPELIKIVYQNVERGAYSKDLIEEYSGEEWEELQNYIQHKRDEKFTYAAVCQFNDKYLVQDRSAGIIYETPQVSYMLISATKFMSIPDKRKRMKRVKKYYDSMSQFSHSIPTPICAGCRTPVKQFSSCVLIGIGDNLDSICAAGNNIIKYVAKKAGIGMHGGRIRAIGSKVGDGSVVHTGLVPFIKKFKGDLKSCSQGGVRGAAGTFYYPWWHYEFPELIVLKNNQGTEETRERHLDYGVELSWKLFKRYLAGEDVYLFSPADVQDMTDAFYSGRFNDFDALYDAYAADPNIRKREVTAEWLVHTFVTERQKTGRIYGVFMENFYNQSPFEASTYTDGAYLSSNLCVAPETTVLTKNGHEVISELEGETVEVWNGEEWSEVVITKTGQNQKLITVTTSHGQSLDCTPYHKFYVFNGYGKPLIEKRAHELLVGDKLAKFDAPVITDGQSLDKPYINGFYSGDGCLTPQGQRVYLYHEKKKLEHLFTDGGSWTRQPEFNRIYKHYKDLKSKFFVPLRGYDLSSRLKWLSGWLDADGCVYRNGINESLIGVSVEYTFLQDIQSMLQTMGVTSKICKASDAGYKQLPLNDGSGKSGEFFCQEAWRLIISSYDTFKLLDAGLDLKRLSVSKRRPQRDAKQFIQVESIDDFGRTDDTYCLNEPKRHMAVFNGIITGQCLEIALPIKDSSLEHEGMVALCTLSSANWGKIHKPSDLEEPCRNTIRGLDALLSYQDYPVKEAEIFTKKYRALGVGIVGFAHFLARRDLKYNKEAAATVDEYMEAFMYYLTDESVRLAEELGPCEGYKDTCYGQGIFPWEKRNKNIDKVVPMVLRYDWEELRQRMIKFGIRNATLSAIAPTESSSQLLGETNGIEPPRKPIVTKESKSGILKQVVPQYGSLKNSYDYLWDQKNTLGYMTLVAVMQKWVDQSISANQSYAPQNYPDGKIPMTVLIRDIIFAFQMGVKTVYYMNTKDSKEDEEDVVEQMSDNDCCVI